MSLSTSIIVIGWMMVLGPAITALWEGAMEDGDIEIWMSQQPLQRLLFYRAMITSGVWLSLTGSVLRLTTGL